MIDASAFILVLSAAAFGLVAGWAGGRVVDVLRDSSKLKAKRLDDFEVQVAAVVADQQRLAETHNKNVEALQQHDREITRAFFLMGKRREAE